MPFIIIDAKTKIDIDGTTIGMIITAQMVGAMLSNIVWAKLSSMGNNKLIAHITIALSIVAISLAFVANNLYTYMLIFILIGASMDGNRISASNLLLILAPEDKRPIYSALQMNIVSFGMFFSIFGGLLLHWTNYNVLYSFSTLCLICSFLLSFKLLDEIDLTH